MPMKEKYKEKKDKKYILQRLKLRIDVSSDSSNGDQELKVIPDSMVSNSEDRRQRMIEVSKAYLNLIHLLIYSY